MKLTLSALVALPFFVACESNNPKVSQPAGARTALSSLQASANSGDVNAQSWLGYHYYTGDIVTKDLSKSFNWWMRAGKQGHIYASARVGLCYYWGYGVQKDLEKAHEWFIIAAMQGEELAQKHLGDMYKKGEFVERNKVQAFAWYSILASQKDAPQYNAADRRKFRDSVTGMTQEQIAEGQKMTKAMIEKNPKLLKQ